MCNLLLILVISVISPCHSGIYMNIRKFFLVISSFTLLIFPVQVFAQDLTVTPSTRRDKAEQRMEDRQNTIDERKADLKAKRTEKQQQIIERMKEKLAAVIDKMNEMAGKLRQHIGRIRTRADEVAKNRGADISKVESNLQEAERHIGLAETEISAVKQKLSELDSTDKPKDVAQTFRTGAQSIHLHFKDARENLVAAVKALKDAAKETRPASTRGDEPTKGAELPE